MARLKIKLKKSTNGRLEKHQRTVEALGLKKIGQTVIRDDNKAVRGMINAVGFMLEVEEVE